MTECERVASATLFIQEDNVRAARCDCSFYVSIYRRQVDGLNVISLKICGPA